MNKGIYLPRTDFSSLHIQSYQLTSVKNVWGVYPVYLLRPNNPKGLPILLIKEILYTWYINTLEIPSWELRNYRQKANFGDDFLIPMVGYGLVPWRVTQLTNLKVVSRTSPINSPCLEQHQPSHPWRTIIIQ